MVQKSSDANATAWWTKTARLHWPQEANKLRLKMKEDREHLFNVFADHEDAKNLIAVFQRLLEDTYALSHYQGIRRGFLIAQQLEKLSRKKNERYKAEIAKIILQHSEDWTAREIYEELDEREVPFIRLGDLPKTGIRLWADVANEPSYKMVITRMKKYTKQMTRVKDWKRIMTAHAKLRKPSSQRPTA